MKILALAILLIAASGSSVAQDNKSYWRNPDGTPVPETSSRKSTGSMSAMILITADQDWQQKWNTPREHVPRFTETSEVGRDGTLFLLTFFGNPAVDEAGRSKLLCDFLLIKPDGSYATEQRDAVCFDPDFAMERDTTYMTNISVGFKADSSEPKGSWLYKVVIKDKIAGTELPLEAGFKVK